MYAVVVLHRQEPVLCQGQGFPFGRAHARQERVSLLICSVSRSQLCVFDTAGMHASSCRILMAPSIFRPVIERIGFGPEALAHVG